MILPFDQILEASFRDGVVCVSFRLGLADGFTLLSRRGEEEDFSALAEDDPIPLIDARPKLDPLRPETRYYRAILHYSSYEVLRFSNEIILTLP